MKIRIEGVTPSNLIVADENKNRAGRILRKITLWLFLKSNAGKNKQFLILIPRHPRRCGDVRKLEKNLFG